MSIYFKKSFYIYLFFLCTLIPSIAQTNPNHVYVKGYYKGDGTYVKPHYRTAPNSTNRDNFSTLGNTNPYTGQAGWITPDNKSINYNLSRYYSNSSARIGICRYENCSDKTTKNSSPSRDKYSVFCEKHIPRCANPSCSKHTELFFGDMHLKYCDSHANTCMKRDCYKTSRRTNSSTIFSGTQTNFCGSHTPNCKNPTCSNYAEFFYGDMYLNYCDSHANTCIKESCFKIARKEKSAIGSLEAYTKYCSSHTPRCEYSTCSDYAQHLYNDIYYSHCRSHN